MSEGNRAGTAEKGQRAPATVFCTPVAIGNFLPNRPSSSVFCQGGQQIGQQGVASATVAEVIPKLCVKAVSKSKKKDAKTFVLRNICIEEASSVPDLKNVIKKLPWPREAIPTSICMFQLLQSTFQLPLSTFS